MKRKQEEFLQRLIRYGSGIGVVFPTMLRTLRTWHKADKDGGERYYVYVQPSDGTADFTHYIAKVLGLTVSQDARNMVEDSIILVNNKHNGEVCRARTYDETVKEEIIDPLLELVKGTEYEMYFRKEYQTGYSWTDSHHEEYVRMMLLS